MAALELLDELQSGYLEVCKVPLVEGGYIRVAVSVNCEWYRQFCRKYMGWGRRRYPKPRTIIRRCHTIKALQRIAAGNMRGVYAERLLEVVEERLGEWQGAGYRPSRKSGEPPAPNVTDAAGANSEIVLNSADFGF